MAGNPYREASSRATRTAARPSTASPSNGPLGPTYKQLDRNGKGVGLGPTRVPDGETFTDVPGRPRRRRPEGRHAVSRAGRRRRSGRTSAFGVGVLTLASRPSS